MGFFNVMVLVFFFNVAGWFRTWKGECFSVTAEHLPVRQSEWGGKCDRQSLPPASEEAQDPQKEVRCSQLAAQRKRNPRVHLRCCGWEAWSKTGEALRLSGRSRKIISLCIVNYTLTLVCNAPSFPSSLLLTWKGQWSIALKALKATGLQMGIVSFTLVCSRCRQDLLSEETGDTKVLAAQCFPAGSAEYKGISRLWLSGRLEKKLLQSTLPGLII